MTPQITILALAVIAAALSVIAALQRVYINKLKTDATYERYKAQKKAEHFEELLTEARNEAKTEYDLRRQAELNLAGANEAARDWRNDAMLYEARLAAVKVTRDPKTGRMVSTKAKPRPTAQEMERGLAAFDAMMGNAIEQLQGLTVRKLCDEVRENAKGVEAENYELPRFSGIRVGDNAQALIDELKNAGSGI